MTKLVVQNNVIPSTLPPAKDQNQILFGGELDKLI